MNQAEQFRALESAIRKLESLRADMARAAEWPVPSLEELEAGLYPVVFADGSALVCNAAGVPQC
jgi:hypothetical protein